MNNLLLAVLIALCALASFNVLNARPQAAGGARKRTFVTDVCQFSDDCASDCCGQNTGKCAGNIVALERDGGCRKNSDGTGGAPPKPGSPAAKSNLK